MFVDDDVDLLFPPLPLPLDWSSKIAVPGTSSVMSPRAIAGIRIATSTPATQSDRRLPTDLDMCRPPGVELTSLRWARRPRDLCKLRRQAQRQIAASLRAELMQAVRD